MARERISGVYCIRHVPTGARYIGSSKNILARWHQHGKALDARTHTSTALQALWDRDGVSAFAFEVLERCEPADLVRREQSWINGVPQTMLLNLSRYAKAASLDPVVAKKIAKSLTGQPHSEERKAKVSASRLGQKRGPHSAIHRERIRQKSLQHRHSLDTRAKIRANHWSRSEEAASIRARLSEQASARARCRDVAPGQASLFGGCE